MRRTFMSLDGLRGVAAIAVLALHVAAAYAPSTADVISAYLAVDMFFLLSGFVIGHAYDDKLVGGMGVARFARIRVIRLYPLYLLGLTIAIVPPILTALASHQLWMAKPVAETLPFAAFMLPRPAMEPGAWFLINPPRWSLFYEMVGNLAYALFARRLGTRALGAIVALNGVFLVVISLRYGSLNLHPTLLIWALTSFARMAFSFSMGLLFYRLWREGRLPTVKCPAIVAVALFLAMIAIPSSSPLAGALTAAAVIVGFPLLLLIGVANEPSARWTPLFHETGRISYALYVLHWPIIDGLAAIAKATGTSVGPAQLAAFPIAIVAAWIASRYYDEPVRVWLQRRTLRRQPGPASSSFGGSAEPSR